MRAKLELALLGPPQIRLLGRPISAFKTLKAQALLFYLAVTGHPHSRSRLAGLLWGGMDETRARVNLSKSLSELRATVDPHINIERYQVGFNQRSDYWLDVRILEADRSQLREGARPSDGKDRSRHPFAEHRELYRGEFLEGFSIRDAPEFETWVLAERERLQSLVAELMGNEVDRDIKGGEWRTGIGNARQLLAIEPWREAAHRQLMVLLASSGQRGAALAQFETCRRILAEELDVEPDATTAALAEQIRSGAFEPAESQGSLPAVEVLSTSARTIDLDVKPEGFPGFLQSDAKVDQTPPVFVARERELAFLQKYLDDALHGRGRVVFVTGEAGGGKTALVQAFMQRAQEAYPSLCVAQGICNAYTGTGDPYLPFREILSMLAGQVEERWAGGAISREQALRLWHGMPFTIEALLDSGPTLINTMINGRSLLERATIYGLPQAQLLERLAREVDRNRGQALEQDQIFRQYGAVLQSLSSRRPLLLVLDDLHWADASSVALLFYLGRTIGQRHILIVGGYRPEDVALTPSGQPHALAEVVHEFRRRFGETEISLDGQSEADGLYFVNDLLDSEPNRLDTVFRQSLFARSQGHPLFTIELLRDIQERGNLVRDEEGDWVQQVDLVWEALPARVEGVIERRIARLSPELREILATAAVEGEDFTAEVVAQVQGIDDLRMVRSLAILDNAHRLIAPSGVDRVGAQRLSKYRFRHSLFQQYLYASLAEMERSYLHEWVGRGLETLYAGQVEPVAVHLGRHFELAGQAAKAARYWLLAGDTAARVHARTEAIASYRRALDLAKTRWAVEELLPLYLKLGRELELASQFAGALEVYTEMEAWAADLGNRPMALQALMAQAVLFTNFNPLQDLARGEAVCKQALDLAQAVYDEAAEAKIRWNLTILYSHTNRLAEAVESGERSIDIARRMNLPEQLALSLNDLGGHCYEVSGHFAKAKQVLGEAHVLWQELGDLNMLADNLAGIAAIGVWEGDYDHALRVGREALRISRDIESLWGQSYSQYKLGWVHWEHGRADLALTTMEETLHLAGISGFGVPQVVTQADVAMLYAELGDFPHAVEAAHRALSHDETQKATLLPYALGALAQVQIRQENLAQAEAILARPEVHAGPGPENIYNAPAVVARAMLSLRQEDYARAIEDARRLGNHSVSAHRPTAFLIEAQAQRALGRADAARASLGNARREAKKIGSRRSLWRILHLQSELDTDDASASHKRRQARRIVTAIAGTVPRADLRAAFLDTPSVRRLLASSPNQ